MAYHRNGRNGATTLLAREGYAGLGGLSDVVGKIGDFIKTGGKAAIDFYGQQQQMIGMTQAQQQQLLAQQQTQARGGLPGWFLPVALVGGGIALVLILKRPRRNPARGRRRRRRRR